MIDYVNKGCFDMYKFDIKQGYHHIDINSEYEKYLGFAWEIKGILKYYVFTVLPFGLTAAPYVFTKTMRVLIKYWRQNNVKFCYFLDDGVGIEKSFNEAVKSSKFVKCSLEKSGFIINSKKSVWYPTRNITWLGINVELNSNTFCISDLRTESIYSTIACIINLFPYTTAMLLVKFCGKIVSTKFVLGNFVQLHPQ